MQGRFSSTNLSSGWMRVRNGPVHITCVGTAFAGATVTIQKRVNGATDSALDADGNALAFTQKFDRDISFYENDEFRLLVTSAAAGTAIPYRIAGDVIKLAA